MCVCVCVAKRGKGVLGPISPDMSNRRAEKWSGVRTSGEQSARLRVTFKSSKLWCNMWLSHANSLPRPPSPPYHPYFFFFLICCTTPKCMCLACVPILEDQTPPRAPPSSVNDALGSSNRRTTWISFQLVCFLSSLHFFFFSIFSGLLFISVSFFFARLEPLSHVALPLLLP